MDNTVDDDHSYTRHIKLKCQCALNDISLLNKKVQEDVKWADEVFGKLDELRSSMQDLSNRGWKDGFEGGAVVMEIEECLSSLKMHHERLKCWMKDLCSICASNIGEIEYLNTYKHLPYSLYTVNTE